jgi:hypothetical protein
VLCWLQRSMAHSCAQLPEIPAPDCHHKIMQGGGMSERCGNRTRSADGGCWCVAGTGTDVWCGPLLVPVVSAAADAWRDAIEALGTLLMLVLVRCVAQVPGAVLAGAALGFADAWCRCLVTVQVHMPGADALRCRCSAGAYAWCRCLAVQVQCRCRCLVLVG